MIPIVALAALVAGWAACEKKQATAKQNQTGQRQDLYIQVSALGSLDYFYDHKLGMREAGELLGVKTEYVGPTGNNWSEMIADFETAISKRPGGIVVVGFEDALVPVINKAVEQGIPVVTVDADLPRSKRVAFVGTGNYNAGFQGGLKLAELVGEKGEVALMTRLGQSNLNERIDGYKAALAKYPSIKVLDPVDTESNKAKAAQEAALLLQGHPNLAGIACVEAAGGSGAATAVKEAGKAGKVKVIAMDRDNAVLKAIEEGVIQASVAQQTALMPIYATMILYQLNHSNLPITTDNAGAGITACPKVIDTGVVIVDQKNCKYFMR
jgi:ribose transport system substrate-binding protein